jgi:hypothetical protein
VNSALYVTGPGILYTAPLATAEPASTVTASAFATTPWASWVAVGSTADGWSFKDEISVEDITAAESYYPVKTITTGRAATADFVLQEISASNIKKALNTTAQTQTGTGATTLTELSPPAVGSEVRSMWGWQSEDNTVRWFAYSCLQVGSLDVKFTKGATPAQLSFSLRLELPANGIPYKIYLAGATRGA